MATAGGVLSRGWSSAAAHWSECASAPPADLCSSGSPSSGEGRRPESCSSGRRHLDTGRTGSSFWRLNTCRQRGYTLFCVVVHACDPPGSTGIPDYLTDEVIGPSQVMVPHRHLQSFLGQLRQRDVIGKLLQRTETKRSGKSRDFYCEEIRNH